MLFLPQNEEKLMEDFLLAGLLESQLTANSLPMLCFCDFGGCLARGLGGTLGTSHGAHCQEFSKGIWVRRRNARETVQNPGHHHPGREG